RGDRDWSDEVLSTAVERLNTWRTAVAKTDDADASIDAAAAQQAAEETVQALREYLANDLDTVGALNVIDEWAKKPTTAEAAGVVATASMGYWACAFPSHRGQYFS